MEWVDSHFVSGVIERIPWAKSHAQVPTLLLKEDRLRVYFATRPEQSTTLLTYCDLDLSDLSRVIHVHDKAVLELGGPGTFDQFGIMPSSVVDLGGGLVYMYYSGWSRSVGVPYSNYTGLAVSEDGGETFRKKFDGPILDRTRFELFSATSPEVYRDANRWHMWYCSGRDWIEVKGKLEHTYDIKYACSDNGIEWRQLNQVAIGQKTAYEAITKPTILKLNGRYHMWYCYRGSLDFRDGADSYRIGYAISDDLLSWKRLDETGGMKASGDWDNEMKAYPAVIRIGGNVYMFYNGNSFGRKGFGFARLNYKK
jgi:hypothetical protein